MTIEEVDSLLCMGCFICRECVLYEYLYDDGAHKCCCKWIDYLSKYAKERTLFKKTNFNINELDLPKEAKDKIRNIIIEKKLIG